MAHIRDGVELIDVKFAPRPGRRVSAIIVALLALLLAHVFVTNSNLQWGVVQQWLFFKTIVSGVMYTLLLTVIATVMGTILAITMAIVRQSVNPVLRWAAITYIWFFRGTPIYIQLIFWSLLPSLYPQMSLGIPFAPPFVIVDTATYFTSSRTVFIGLSLNEGAYLVEIIRAGLLSVDKGQWEAVIALGIPRSVVFRRIILPQAIHVTVPLIGNEAISMPKMTSLVSAIPYTPELTLIASMKKQNLFRPVPFLITAALWHLFITTILIWVQSRIECHFGKGPERREDTNAEKTTNIQFLDVTL